MFTREGGASALYMHDYLLACTPLYMTFFLACTPLYMTGQNLDPSTVNGPWCQHIVELGSETWVFELSTLKIGGWGGPNITNGPRYNGPPLA